MIIILVPTYWDYCESSTEEDKGKVDFYRYELIFLFRPIPTPAMEPCRTSSIAFRYVKTFINVLKSLSEEVSSCDHYFPLVTLF